MKVLLIGDYSSFHVNLAAGLKCHGVEVDILSNGDGFKETRSDIRIPKKNIQRLALYRNLLKNIGQYDLVQLMSDASPHSVVSVNTFLVRAISKKVPVYLVAAGCDYRFWTKGRERLNIPLFDEIEKYGEKTSIKTDFLSFLRNRLVLRYITGVIGFNEYFETYRDHKKCLYPIVLPIELEDSTLPLSWDNGPLIVLHGLQRNRSGFKGSDYIEKAFDELNKKYPNELKCICAGNMPYHEYKKILAKCHVVVDQTNAISYGMNALLGMAMGKIVFSSNQNKVFYDKWLPLLDIKEYPPIFPLKPDSNFIVKQIEDVLCNRRDELQELSRKSRDFAEKYHNCKTVAGMFLENWKNLPYLKGK